MVIYDKKKNTEKLVIHVVLQTHYFHIQILRYRIDNNQF